MNTSNSLKILLLNVHSGKNAGDAALTFAAIQQLKSNLPGCRVTLAVNDVTSFSDCDPVIPSFWNLYTIMTPYGVKRSWFSMLWLALLGFFVMTCYRITGKQRLGILPSKARVLFREVLDSDLVVSTPGGYLYNMHGVGFAFLGTILPLYFAVWAGKPLYLMPQSFGPFRFSWECWLVRKLTLKARLVMTREPGSTMLLKSIGVPDKRITETVDIAFSYQGSPLSEAEKWLSRFEDQKRPRLGITAINWARQGRSMEEQEQYEAAVAAAVQSFIQEHDAQVWFFAQCTGPAPEEDDRYAARRIANQIDGGGHLVMVEEPLTPDLLKALYGSMDLFMGTRMHSNIFALSQYVPVLAIGYMPKTRGIMEQLDLNEWVVDIRSVSPDQLSTLLEKLWNERGDVRDHLLKRIPPMIEKSLYAGQLIARDVRASIGSPQ